MKKLKLENAGGQPSQVVTKARDTERHKKKRKKNTNKFKIRDPQILSTDIKEELPVPVEGIKTEEGGHVGIGFKFNTLWTKYNPRSTTLIRAGGDWYEQLLVEDTENVPLDPATKKHLKDLARRILQQDVDNYNKAEQRGAGKEDVKFRKTVYSQGTYRDKIAANVLRCMEAPVHSLGHLNALIEMISPKSTNEYEEALDSIFQLLKSTLLPDGRVARRFESHHFSSLLPLISHSRERVEKALALWYFEDQLAFAHRKLVFQLTKVAAETVDKTKMNGIRGLVKLLKTHPGQDAEHVLEAVINKLGDPSRKVAAQTMQSLSTVLSNCSQLKATVVTLVEILLYRTNVTGKTQYYCLCYLKDILFNKSDYALAAKLVKLYIGFFKACTKKGEVDTRLMGALLRGINRAFPFSRLEGETLQMQLETLYKLCHIVSFNIATQALQLIYQVITKKNQVEDRFYQALYGQIHDPAFGTSTGNTAFLNLVFKAMMRDDSIERRQAFIKRLLQVGQYQSPNVSCGILFLISEIIKEKPEMKEATNNVLKNYVDPEDTGDFETFEDVEDVDDDGDDKGINKETSDTKEEVEDYKQEVIDNTDDESKCSKLPDVPVPMVSSWFHRANTNLAKSIKRDHYDPFLRNPQYCGAHFSPLWELVFLQGHYHPSVSVFSSKIIDGGIIDYSGDPIQDFTVMRFLDRFVYKNPKKNIGQKDNSAAVVLGSRVNYCPEGPRGIAVNAEEFLKLDSKEVPEDQKFFHSYFKQFKANVRKVTKADDDDDNESIADDEFDNYLSDLGGAKNDKLDFDEDLDFASGATAPVGQEDEDGSDNDIDGGDEEPEFGGKSDGFDDEELDFEGDHLDDDFGGGDGDNFGEDDDFGEEDIAFSDDGDIRSAASMKKTGKSLPKKRKAESFDSMFASADDFAQILEDNADEDHPNAITSKALANKDRAHAKQLRWEEDRDDRINERGRFGSRGKQKGRGGQNRKFGKSSGPRNFKHSAGGHKKNFKNTRGKSSFKSKRGRKK